MKRAGGDKQNMFGVDHSVSCIDSCSLDNREQIPLDTFAGNFGTGAAGFASGDFIHFIQKYDSGRFGFLNRLPCNFLIVDQILLFVAQHKLLGIGNFYAARTLAERLLLTSEAEAERVSVTAPITAIGIAPGQSIMVPGDARRWRVARAQVENHAVTLDLLPVVAVGDVDIAADAGAPTPGEDAPVGGTLIQAFELPPLTDALVTVPQLLVAASGTGAGWRGAALAVSSDGVTWTDVGASAAPAVMGQLALPLPRADAALRDEANAIEVTLAHADMTLLSADPAALDRGANLALIGDELVQFATAAMVSAGLWRLTRIWRGRRATEPATHPPGARFVLIEAEALAVVPLADRAPGDAVHVLASGVGDTRSTVVALTGASIAPPAPAHLRASSIAGGDVLLRWTRRSRLGWRWQDGVDAPLVEERESYRVTIDAADGSRREVPVDTPELTIPAADRAGGTATVEVRQLGTFAASHAARITIEGV